MFGLFKRKKEKKIKLEDILGPDPGGKYPSKPIYREVVFRPRADGISCPKCGSKLIRAAGYSDRFECQNCKNVFG